MLIEFFFGGRFEVWITVCVTVLIYILTNVVRNFKKRIPPGPLGLPILGYIPFLTRDVHLDFTNLSKKYGEVFSVRLGSELVFVLNDFDSIKEAFGKNEFLGRPPHSAFSILANKSPFFAPDLNVWQEQRRFVVQAMKDLGLGRSKIEGLIQEEVHEFLKALRSYDGKPMDLMVPLTPSMSNNMGSLVYGHRYDYDHPDRKLFDESINIVTRIVGQTAPYVFFPWIRHVPFLLRWFNLEEGVKAIARSDRLLLKKIEEHKATFDPKNIRDFIDSYFLEMKIRQRKDPNTSFNDATLAANVGDLFGAGSETVRTSLSWCIYTMAAYQDIQKKVQNEIQEVLGTDRGPEMLDQKLMPYTNAVILEVMRWKPVIPLNIMRYTTADTSVGKFHVPKHSIVIANFWAVHQNPKYWTEPEKFIPERFLSPDKKSALKPIHLMTFSVGKRLCPGEAMANMEMFLYFVSVLQKFNVKLPPGVSPTFEAELFTAYRPKPYEVCFIPRS